MKKQPQYSIMSAAAIVLAALALITLLPRAASKPDLLGFRTLCAFVPLSTLTLLGVAGFVCVLRETLYKVGTRPGGSGRSA